MHRHSRNLWTLFAVGLVCGALALPSVAPASALKALEGRVRMGTVSSYYEFRLRWDDGRFNETMRREYGMVMAPDVEWHAPWDEQPIRPARNIFDLTVKDGVVAFIESAGLRVRGHPLLHPHWQPGVSRTLPAWLVGDLDTQ